MFARNSILVLAISISLLNCKTNQRVDGKQHGVWIAKFPLDSINNKLFYKSKEVFNMGMPVRTWKYYMDGKITRKEKYKKDLSAQVTFYHENGKVEKKGKTKIQISDKEAHWFYDGPWDFYDETGKQTKIVHYNFGLAMKTDSILVK